MATDHDEVATALEKIQSLLGSEKFPCRFSRATQTCITRYDGKLDKDGRPMLWFAIDCPRARELCDTCLAYWLVAVARNAVMHDRKMEQLR